MGVSGTCGGLKGMAKGVGWGQHGDIMGWNGVIMGTLRGWGHYRDTNRAGGRGGHEWHQKRQEWDSMEVRGWGGDKAGTPWE